MKILTIRLKNLTSIEGTFEVDFTAEPLRSAGIFAISGPTGAGKSTILDALCLALYDKTPRFAASGENLYLSDVGENQVNQSDVKNILRRGTGEGFAEVDFIGITGRRYRSRWSVRRARSKATGSLQPQTIQVTDLDKEEELQGTKTELLNQLVALVGLTYEQFTRTVLLAQNDFATFLKSRESAKAELLEKLTGTEIYSRISREIYARSKAADEAMNLLKNTISLIELIPEEELLSLRKEQERLIGLRFIETKRLTELNAQLSIVQSLKIRQKQLYEKQQEEFVGVEELKRLQTGLAEQMDYLARFQEQWEALQPELRKARELDVRLQSLRTQYRQSEQTLLLARKQTAEIEKKYRTGKEPLSGSQNSMSILLKGKDNFDNSLPIDLQRIEQLLLHEEQQLTTLQQENDNRVSRLNTFGIQSVSEEQNKLLKKAIEQKPDAILFSPSSMDSSDELLKEAKEKGIRITYIDSYTKEKLQDLTVATDNVNAGRMLGEYARKLIDKDSKIAIVSHVKGVSTAVEREQGFREGLGDYADNIVDIVYCNSLYEKSYELAQELMRKYPDLELIAGMNEYSAVGVGRAVSDAGAKDKIAVVGVDCSQEAINLMEMGVYKGIIVQKAFRMGYIGVEETIHMLNGDAVEKNIDSGCELVTPENMYNSDIERLIFPFS